MNRIRRFRIHSFGYVSAVTGIFLPWIYTWPLMLSLLLLEILVVHPAFEQEFVFSVFSILLQYSIQRWSWNSCFHKMRYRWFSTDNTLIFIKCNNEFCKKFALLLCHFVFNNSEETDRQFEKGRFFLYNQTLNDYDRQHWAVQ